MTSRLRTESTGIVWSRRERVRKRAFRWMWRLTATATVCAGLMTVSPAFGFGFMGALAGAALSGLAGAMAGRRRVLESARFVEVAGGQIVFELDGARAGKHRVALASVEQGFVEEAIQTDAIDFAEGHEAVLRLRDGVEVAIRVADAEKAEALLEAAGVSTKERVVRVPIRSAASVTSCGEVLGVLGLLFLLPYVFVCGGGLVGTIAYLPGWQASGNLAVVAVILVVLTVLNALVLLGVRGLARWLRRREVIVGADGIAIEGFGRRVFHGYSEMRDVVRSTRGVEVALRSGRVELLPTIVESSKLLPVAEEASVDRSRLPAGPEKNDLSRREALFARIQQARSRYGRTEAPSIAIEHLDRRGRGLDEWMEALKRVTTDDGAGSYRRVRVATDHLIGVVEDAGAPAERRIAAAVALSHGTDAAAKARVRVAVDACANEDLRAALERAAEGEIDEGRLRRVVGRRA